MSRVIGPAGQSQAQADMPPVKQMRRRAVRLPADTLASANQKVHEDGRLFFDFRDTAQARYEMVRRVATGTMSMLEAAEAFGVSRKALAAAQRVFDKKGMAGLVRMRMSPRSVDLDPYELKPEVMGFVRAEGLDARKLTRKELVHIIWTEFGIGLDASIPAWTAFTRTEVGATTTAGMAQEVLAFVNPRAENAGRPFFDPSDRAQARYEMLRMAFTGMATKQEAAKAFSVSRPTYFLAERVFVQWGVAGLVRNPWSGTRQPRKLKPEVVDFVGAEALDNRKITYKDLAHLIWSEFGVVIERRSLWRLLKRGRQTMGGRRDVGGKSEGG